MPDITGVLGAVERAGGYAALFALFGIGLFLLANKQMTQGAKRASERESEAARKHEEDLAQERASAQEHRADKLLLVDAFQSHAKSTQELSGVLKGVMSEMREVRRDFSDLRLEVTNRSLPKRASKRKPTAIVERTVTVETKATAEGEATEAKKNE